MDKVRIGVIGMGGMGCQYAQMIGEGKIHGMELSAVTRIKKEMQERVKGFLKEDIPVFQSDKELMECDGIDAVLIATPHYAHPGQVIAALNKGLHVLCDKPAGVYTRQAREMNETAAGKDLVFGMIFNQRANPVFQELRQIVKSGRYGGLKRVNWIVTDWYRPQSYYDAGTWRAAWETDGGGVLLNQCPHNLDLLQWICGMPVGIQAFCHEGKWHHIQVEDDVTAYMEFENGATGVFVTSTGDAPGTNRLEITLEDAKILVEKNEQKKFEMKIYELAVREREFCFAAEGSFDKPQGRWCDRKELGEDSSYIGILSDFAKVIRERKKPAKEGETLPTLLAEGKEGINSLMMSNAMYLSSWTGKMVELPIDEEVFLKEFQKKIKKM